MECPLWPSSCPALSKTIAAVTPGRSINVCRIASISPSHGGEVVERALHGRESPGWLHADGDDRPPPDGDDAAARGADERRAHERPEPELLRGLSEARRDETGDGGHGLAVRLADGVVEHAGDVAEHRAGDVRDPGDQREVVHVRAPCRRRVLIMGAP